MAFFGGEVLSTEKNFGQTRGIKWTAPSDFFSQKEAYFLL